MQGRLTKSRNKWIDGVLGGIANYIGVNPDFLRIGFLVAFFILDFGFLLPAYILMIILMPGPGNSEEATHTGNNMRMFGIILVVGGVYYLLRNTFFYGIMNSINHFVNRLFPFFSSFREVFLASVLIGAGFWLLTRERKQ